MKNSALLLLLASSLSYAAPHCEDVATATAASVEDISQRAPAGRHQLVRSTLLGKVPTAFGANYKWEVVVRDGLTSNEGHYQLFVVGESCVIQSLKRFKPMEWN